MNELFPRKQVMGFAFSLVLTLVALSVIMFDLSLKMGDDHPSGYSFHASCTSICHVHACRRV